MNAASSDFSIPAVAVRGIYWADFKLEGRPVMFGVSSSGELVALVPVAPGSESLAAQHIETRLNVTDPPDVRRPSHLRLLPPE